MVSTIMSPIRGEVPDIVEVLSDSDKSDDYDSDDGEYEPLSGDDTSDESRDESDSEDKDEGTEPPLGPLAVSSIGFSGPSSTCNATTMSEMEMIQSTTVCNIGTAPNTCDVGISTEDMYTTASTQTDTTSDMLEQTQHGETSMDNATMVGIEMIMVYDDDSISDDEIRIDIIEDEEDSSCSATILLPQVPSPQTVTTQAPDNHINAETILTSDNSPSKTWAMSTAIVPYSHGYYGYSSHESAASSAEITPPSLALTPPAPARLRSLSEVPRLPTEMLRGTRGCYSTATSPQIRSALPLIIDTASSPMSSFFMPSSSPTSMIICLAGSRRAPDRTPSLLIVTYKNLAFPEQDRLRLRHKCAYEIPRPIMTHRTQHIRGDLLLAFGITLSLQNSSPGVNVAEPGRGGTPTPRTQGGDVPSPNMQGSRGEREMLPSRSDRSRSRAHNTLLSTRGHVRPNNRSRVIPLAALSP
ncbi:hypothetical protein COEREDRAFT_11845 [Coemansia reversa NRRL 1564]|uniref:Uncharacterized protein n=1 Tax=Coemansia reversa (strain ATCC 12441 / NRRL 1564) TaxID=763665 RepID=A0A2G5B2U2_COERN|nr:hypothetical protein COEREDRAFT_11845 [Coemansia reversa NRRL 1564]|eukprot:PIA13027.1 hypothetical protein COEREDRAFT_11845 [Coemansia reversa NRRL 1564]